MENIKNQIEKLSASAEQIISKEALAAKIKTKKKLRIKFGADPSAPDLHFGHMVILKKLREFQECGHEVIFVIGDFTGVIGDPTGRSKTRPILTKEEMMKNANTYKKQVFKILDEKKTKIVFNSAWYNEMSFEKVLSLTSKLTLARIIEREDFMKRYRGGIPISITELLYPIIQAYDSVHLESNVELGGTDQTFNLLLARELQKEFNQEPQVVLTMPILPGLDGKMKMSKSLGNTISLQDSAKEIFGKTMSIPDNLIIPYFRLLTQMEKGVIDAAEKAMFNGENPKIYKEKLGKNLVSLFYDDLSAQQTAQEFSQIFQKGGEPAEMPEILIKEEELEIMKIIELTKKFASNGEIRRLIEGGGVRYEGKKIETTQQKIKIEHNATLKIGKRTFFRTKKK